MSKSILRNKWFYIALIIVFAIIYFAVPKVSSGEYNTFAKCLTEKGLVMYGTDWCPHCQNQKALLGDSFDYITSRACSKLITLMFILPHPFEWFNFSIREL